MVNYLYGTLLIYIGCCSNLAVSTLSLPWSQETCTGSSVFDNLADSAFTSSGESRTDREPSQVRLTRKGWCPKEQVDSLAHIYLEVTFLNLVNIMAIEMRGIDEGGVSYVVEQYMLDYQRDESSEWLRYSKNNAEILKGGRNWYDEFRPSIFARRVRFIPVSNFPTEICVTFELYGCYYTGGVVSYAMSVPMAGYEDLSYDGPPRGEGWLRKGVGYLTDGVLGNVSGPNWVGWSSSQKRTVNITFKFDTLRDFRRCSIHMLTQRENNILPSSLVTFVFVQDSPMPENEVFNGHRGPTMNGERWYEFTFAKPRVTNEVRMSLSFLGAGHTGGSTLLLISEVFFESVPVDSSVQTTSVRTSRRPTSVVTQQPVVADSGTTSSSSRLPTTRKAASRRAKVAAVTVQMGDFVSVESSTETSTRIAITSNTTLPQKQAGNAQTGVLMPVVVGVVVLFLAICLVLVVVLARKYCCDAKHYQYWHGSRPTHSAGKSALKGSREARNNSGALALMSENCKPTIIANPLNASESNDKFSGLDDASRLMLMHGATNSQQHAAPLFTFNNLPATVAAPKITSPAQRFENSSYVSLPPDDSRSGTTRTNSIVAVPVLSSHNASIVSGDVSTVSYRPAFSADPFPQAYTNFNTVNMNGAMFLLSHSSADNAANHAQFAACHPPMLAGAQAFDAQPALRQERRTSDVVPPRQHSGEQLATLTMNRSTRKRKHNQPRARNSHRHAHNFAASESGVRSSSSLSNQSALSPAATGAHSDIQTPSAPKPDSSYLYDVPTVVSSYNTMSSVGVGVGVGVGAAANASAHSALERFKLQGLFGSCRLRCADEASLERVRAHLAPSALARTRVDNLKFIQKVGEGMLGEIYMCEMHFVETDLDSAVSNSASTSNNASGESGHSSLSHGESGQSTRLCLAKLLRSALTGQYPAKDVRNAITRELDCEVALLTAVNDANLQRMTHIVVEDDLNFDTRLGIVFEYTTSTTLFDYFRACSLDRRAKPYVRPPSSSFTMHVAMQIASGMKHLESMNMTHCDLAARNCLITDQCTVKVCDHAIASRTFEKHYYVLDLGESKVRLPLRWMSWEALLRGRFSTHSDVWSFAVTMWELLTDCADLPFSDLDDDQVIENLNLMHTYHEANEPYFPTLSTKHSTTNSRLSTCSDDVRSADEAGRYKHLLCPTYCPRELYDLMRECWNRDETSRPSFREIHLFLQRKCIGYDPKEDLCVSFIRPAF